MMKQFYDSEVINIIDETPFTKRFFFRVPGREKFEFIPGQFVMLDLPIDSKIKNRSYSIASAPGDDNIFELIISLHPQGLGTPTIFHDFKTGMKVPVAGPLGKFSLPAKIDRDLCFVCTGTGIAPFRSMLHHIYTKNIPHQNIYLIFGSRTKEDILYYHEMTEMAAAHPEFYYTVVLSRETPETWKGKTGYVHQVYEELFADHRPAYFYLCGWSAMLKEAREQLSLMGYTKEFIKFELYD